MLSSNGAGALASMRCASAEAKQWLWPSNGADRCASGGERLDSGQPARPGPLQLKCMNENFEKTAEQISAFQKIWTESITRMMQTAFATGSNSAPPEVLRQIRSGMLQALAQSWEEF